jgi:hypothetical protein
MQMQHTEAMIERGPDRRWRKRAPGLLLPEQRDGLDRRAMVAAAAPGVQGLIRPGVGEVQPLRERRRYLDSGME